MELLLPARARLSCLSRDSDQLRTIVECEVADLDSMSVDGLITSIRPADPPCCCVVLRTSLLDTDSPNRELILSASQEIVHTGTKYRAVEIQDVELLRSPDPEWYRISFARSGIVTVNNVRLLTG